MMKLKHWQDPANALVGAWLIASPWILGVQGNSPALSSFLILGMALVATAVGAMWLPRAWEEWTEVALGGLLMTSPWLFAFSTLETARTNAILSGLVILALALWVLGTDKDWGFLREDRIAH